MVLVGVYLAKYVYVPAAEMEILELDHAHEPSVPKMLGYGTSFSVKPGL